LMKRLIMEYDVFISHASEDKQDVARPLAERLNQLGLRVWLDEIELVIGDSLRRNIDIGLSKSKFGVVVLSKDFFKKEWTQKELDGLVAREDGETKIILPIWHNVTIDDVKKYSPILADKLAVPTNQGLSFVVDRIIQAIKREEVKHKNVEPIFSKNIDDDLIINEDSDSKTGAFHSISRLFVQMLDTIQERADSKYSELITGVPTGFLDFDRLISGLQPGNIALLASRPSMGKTDFLLNIATHIAIVEQLPVVIFSLDQTAAEMTNRMTTIVGNICTRRLDAGNLLDEEWSRLIEAAEKFKNTSILIDDKSNQSIEKIRESSTRALELFGAIGAIMIDGIQLIHKDGADKSNYINFDLLKAIRNLSKELNSPIIVTSQLDRRAELRVDKRPILTDLDNITGIDQYADTIIFLYKSDLYRGNSSTSRKVELLVAKQKKGPAATIELAYTESSGAFAAFVDDNKI
jgi:replicative DNA helicase